MDDTRRFQTLIGIGAGIGYQFDEIARHPRKAALFDAMFSESGLSVLRLRNRYGQQRERDLGGTGEIVAAAAQRLGRNPTIILNSASPPGSLKANGSNWCEGNPATCTLARLPGGAFDYAGLANHWRASLDAYAAAGVVPDYISIQNNPNWVPDDGDANEACKFLPSEGTAIVATSAGDTEVEYPGYVQALDAVLESLAGLATVPKIVAPETTGIAQVADYMVALDSANVDAIAHHLYGTDSENLDHATLAELGRLGQERQRPIFQTEMYADSLTTAVLMHASFAVEGASIYVHNAFVASASEANPDGLINLTTDDFALGDTYHVVRHYAGHIRPGWVRVAAESNSEELLASAWLSSAGDGIAVVLTNPGQAEVAVKVDAGMMNGRNATEVTRTVLNGIERSAELGALAPDGIVTLPGQSIATLRFQR